MNIQELYIKLEGDYNDAAKRLINDKMVARFVLKFPEDPSFQQLLDAVEAKDIETSFRAIHTLKGVAGVLAFSRLYRASCNLTEQLRPRLDLADPELLREVDSAYRLCIDSINEFKDSME